MSLEDFKGAYEVQTASGTNFGTGTIVTIEVSDNEVTVHFALTTGAEDTRTGETVTYDSATDSLKIALDAPTQAMWISRFTDPDSGYQAIYGITVMGPPAADEVRRSPVWSAKAIVSGAGGNSPAGTALSEEDFSGTYTVRTTADAQFGTGSRIDISDKLQLSISNALGQTVLSGVDLKYDPSTVSVSGEPSTETKIVMSLSVDDGGVKHVYGCFIVGDPEQGGTYGGDDEGGGFDPDERIRK